MAENTAYPTADHVAAGVGPADEEAPAVPTDEDVEKSETQPEDQVPS